MGLINSLSGFLKPKTEEKPLAKKKSFLSSDLENLFDDPDMDRLRAEAENSTEFTDKLRRVYR